MTAFFVTYLVLAVAMIILVFVNFDSGDGGPFA